MRENEAQNKKKANSRSTKRADAADPRESKRKRNGTTEEQQKQQEQGNGQSAVLNF
jgi:hypothetical protein